MLGRRGRAGAAVTSEPAGDPVPTPDLLASLDPRLCCPGPLAKSSALGCTALHSLPRAREGWSTSLVGEKGREKITRDRGCVDAAAQGREPGAGRERDRAGRGCGQEEKRSAEAGRSFGSGSALTSPGAFDF